MKVGDLEIVTHFFQASLDLTRERERFILLQCLSSLRRSHSLTTYEILHIIYHLPFEKSKVAVFMVIQLYYIVFSTTYLPCFVNVVKERPLNALLGPFAPLKLRLNCCSKSSKCVRAA